MKTILCFGDSNTWGYNAATKERFAPWVRWCGVMREILGDGFFVIEEGLNGRTTVWDDPIEGYKNGETYLIPCLESHRPIDLIIIMLGTNDTKKRFSLSAFDIAAGMEKLLKIIAGSGAGVSGNCPEILLMSPPHIGTLSEYSEMLEGAEEISKRLAPRYFTLAQNHGCHFLDTVSIINTTDVDGIHMDAEAHGKLGVRVAQIVREILD